VLAIAHPQAKIETVDIGLLPTNRRLVEGTILARRGAAKSRLIGILIYFSDREPIHSDNSLSAYVW
jgi:hypothetical protein